MKKNLILTTFLIVSLCCSFSTTRALAQDKLEAKLEKLLKRFPAADLNKDGTLSLEEAKTYRDQFFQKQAAGQQRAGGGGARRNSTPDPRWEEKRFPEDAICYRTPKEIAKAYGKEIPSHPKPTDGSLRIVGTGHSFMRPGYGTLPAIAQAAGFQKQALHTHIGGGVTGGTRYKWEQENGIFGFEKKGATPRLLAAISNAKWDVMTWGPYSQDRLEYYACWIDFCLKYNPEMKFYLSDAWPQISQLDTVPKNEEIFTPELFDRLGKERDELFAGFLKEINSKYPDKVFIMPTNDAMVLAAKHYLAGKLPGIEGVNTSISGKKRSLWRDRLGHLGPGFERLEGYVFYATLYGRSPELIKEKVQFEGDPSFPSPQLDQVFRKIAWQAVINNPLSGVTDKNGDGLCDSGPKK